MNDLDSTEYDVKEIEDDPRFTDGKKEFWFLNISSLIITGVAVCICYVLGSDVSGIKLVWGYPAWYFWATVILCGGVVLYIFWFFKFFKTPSLAPRADNSQKEDKKL